MANIKGFIAPDRKITPAAEGFSAFETMGRRVGALYNEAGNDYARVGKLQAQELLNKKWPFDILALENSVRRGGFRVKGLSQNDFTGPTDAFPNVSYYNAHDQISAGAAALSQGGELIDIASGTMQIGRGKVSIGTYDPNRLVSVDQPGYSPGDVTSEVLPGSVGGPPAPVQLPNAPSLTSPNNPAGDYGAMQRSEGFSIFGSGPTPPPVTTSYPSADNNGPPAAYTDNNPNAPGFLDNLGSWMNSVFGGGGGNGSVSDYGVPGSGGNSGY